ncbi:hypothetical protein V5F40_22665 [Xanthobacter sp. DSM 14520]|uniref:AAA family ATPase n=1 Tax=Xanthobacter autotrophicus (strain ATCC BAA-1158 / Py2) TaxID=78245 RepID=UPI0037278A0C
MLQVSHAPFPRMSLLALCQSRPVISAIEEACASSTMARVRPTIEFGGAEKASASVEAAAAKGRLRIVIFETRVGAKRAEIMDELAQIAQHCDEDTNVFVVGHENDVNLYRALLEEGVADYLVAPITAHEVLQSLSDRLSVAQEVRDAGALIAVVGTRGGAGATTVAANLAWLIANERRMTTGLLDLDLPFGGVASAFDVKPDPELSSLLYTPERIADTEMLERIFIRKGDRLHLICATADLEKAGRREFGAGHAHLASLLRAEFEASVVDLPLHWNGAAEELLVKATRVVLVTTPDFSGIAHAQVLLRHLAELRTDAPVVVLNQIGTRDREEWSSGDVQKALGTGFVSIRTDMKAFSTAASQGSPLCEVTPSHTAAKAFRQVVSQLLGAAEEEVAEAKGSSASLLAGVFALARVPARFKRK